MNGTTNIKFNKNLMWLAVCSWVFNSSMEIHVVWRSFTCSLRLRNLHVLPDQRVKHQAHPGLSVEIHIPVGLKKPHVPKVW